jgi:protein SCO1/2
MTRIPCSRLMQRTAAVALALTLCAGAAAAPATAPPLPSDSVYQLAATLTDQNGRSSPLQGWRGEPVIVAMFYSSCQFTCPMVIEALRATETALAAGERARLRVLMVSIDPEHDTVAVLERMATERRIDTARWTLARADAPTVRKLAAVLGVQYRALGNGDFNHSTALILVDSEGSIRARTARLGQADPAFVKRVKAVLQDPR